jgi:hypothetical protein
MRPRLATTAPHSIAGARRASRSDHSVTCWLLIITTALLPFESDVA